jgi:Asp-tRNA(Asn)/Glu-tRNA(Gln) amidotransferase A subunit family amidase
MRMALKDNIAVKDLPMLFGTDMFTNYVPDVDASKNYLMKRKVYADF